MSSIEHPILFSKVYPMDVFGRFLWIIRAQQPWAFPILHGRSWLEQFAPEMAVRAAANRSFCNTFKITPPKTETCFLLDPGAGS
jgi:hypothetical protein